MAAGLAHQNEQYPDVTPDRIRRASRDLVSDLRSAGVDFTVFPTAEVMLRPDIVEAWKSGALLSIGDRGQYLLVEMPHRLFVDFRSTAESFRAAGIRPILAHPERQPELLHGGNAIDELIRAGCLVQVSSGSVTDPKNSADAKALRSWFRRGVVHVLGSDGHSPTRRPPRMAAAYREIARWAGTPIADRVCSTNGIAVLTGLPLRLDPPEPERRSWFSRFW